MKNTQRIFLLMISLFSIFVIPSFNTSVAQEKNAEKQVRQLYKQGIELLEKQRPEPQKAYDKLQEAIQKSNKIPAETRGELLRWLWDSTTEKTFEAMLGDPRLKHAAERIMELAKGAFWTWKMDQKRIQDLVRQLMSDNYQKQLEAQHRLMSAGQYAAPALIDQLRSDRTRNRSMALLTLSKMGVPVVLPVIEALESDHEIQRVNAAAVLGDLKDIRALPALKRLIEEDESKRVRSVAAKSIQKIIDEPIPRPWEEREQPLPQHYHESNGQVIMGLKEAGLHHHHPHTHPDKGITSFPHEHNAKRFKSAKKLYLELGEKYYHTTPDITRKLYGDSLIWRWDEQEKRVKARRVPDFMFNDELAKQVFHDGLALDSGFTPIWTRLINVYFNIFHESEQTLTTAKQLQNIDGPQKVIEENALSMLKKDLAERDQTLLPGELLGSNMMYKALSEAVVDNKPLVAISCMNVLQDIGASKELPGTQTNPRENQQFPHAFPIVSALIHEDLRMQYHAARLLVSMEPQKKFLAWDRVVPTLADAVQTSGIRQVLVAESDTDDRNELISILRNPNLHSQIHQADSPEQLLNKGKNFPEEDLILLDGDMAGKLHYSFEVPGAENQQQRVIDSLRKNLRTKNVPIVLVADDDDQKTTLRNTYETAVDGYLSFPITPEKLERTFQNVQKESFALKSRETAEELALMGARSLTDIQSDNPVFTNYDQAVPALIGTLENRPDDLRVAASEALGNFGNKKAIQPLAKTLNNADNPDKLRKTAGRALAKIFEQNRNYKPKEEVLEVLVDNMHNTPYPVQTAASRALGSSGISNEKRRQLLEKHKEDTDQLGEPALGE